MGKQQSRSAAEATQYWLFKSEPTSYSIHDLEQDRKQTTFWDGVRNYQARNFLRDRIRLGDRVLFYHSNADPLAIVGTAEVVKTGYPDHTAFDPANHHYDPKSNPDEPAWYMVDIRLLQIFPEPLTRAALGQSPALAGMELLKRGSRLSVQPVTADEWRAIHKLAGVPDKPAS
jgi:predicted RNA-binding protein with PUA-like domain